MSGTQFSECGLPSSQVMKLLNADLRVIDDVIHMKPSELSQASGLSLKESVEVLRIGVNKSQQKSVNMIEMLQEGSELPKIVTFCKALDTLLGGGIPLQAITEVSGTSGIGKTQLCLQACVCVQLPQSVGGIGGEAVYVDTEGSFTVKRLKEIATHAVHHVQTITQTGGEDVSHFTLESIMKGIHYFRCQNSIEVLAVIKNIPNLIQTHPKIQLLVVDSISFHFRYGFPDARDRVKLLRTMTKELIHPAVTHRMAVLVMNHMTTQIKEKGSSALVPALGEIWGHCPTLRLNLMWCGPNRVATLTKAPHCQNASVCFQVTAGGVRDVCENANKPVTSENLDQTTTATTTTTAAMQSKKRKLDELHNEEDQTM